jgi:hypothetical protein
VQRRILHSELRSCVYKATPVKSSEELHRGLVGSAYRADTREPIFQECSGGCSQPLRSSPWRWLASLVTDLTDNRVEPAFDLLQTCHDIRHPAIGTAIAACTVAPGPSVTTIARASRSIAWSKRPAPAEIWSAHRTASKSAESTRSSAHSIRSANRTTAALAAACCLRSSHSIGSSPRKPSIG